MPINEYLNEFSHLVGADLPALLAQMDDARKKPNLMADFAIRGAGVVTLARKLGMNEDFPGCYLLIEGTRPIYVGISRGVLKRLRQHVLGNTHYDASLAYRIAEIGRAHAELQSQSIAYAVLCL